MSRNGTGKAERHREIARLLAAGEIPSQAELARLLYAASTRVTQATLSRDLEELGAFKARGASGRTAYRLPEDPAENGAWLPRMLREFATGFDASGPLVVVRTPPGGAGAVARALDAGRLPDVLGTVAGDDTIIVVCRAGVPGTRVAKRLRQLAGTQRGRE